MIGQRETIKQILDDGLWHCGTEFQKLYIPEYRTRINELRKKGCVIETRRCQQHQHKGVMQEWRLPKEIRPQNDKRVVPKETPRISQNIASGEACCLDKQLYGVCFKKHEPDKQSAQQTLNF